MTLLASIVLPCLTVMACSRSPENVEDYQDNTELLAQVADSAHNSRNALDWAGSYRGVLPCADCEGIETSVTLNYDGTYLSEALHAGRETTPSTDTGKFAWNGSGSEVILRGSAGDTQAYQVGENRLFRLDRDGMRVGGDRADLYALKKAD